MSVLQFQGILSPFQQYIVVLMTLRLILGAQDIAHRFGVSQSTVSLYCNNWINVMYVRLQRLVKWPRREELRKTLPWTLGLSSRNALSS